MSTGALAELPIPLPALDQQQMFLTSYMGARHYPIYISKRYVKLTEACIGIMLDRNFLDLIKRDLVLRTVIEPWWCGFSCTAMIGVFSSVTPLSR